jgi:peptidyl-Lys metalloendopeptidase
MLRQAISLAFAAALLAAGPAAAQGAAKPRGPAPGACTAEQMAVIDAAFAEAATRTAAAIAFLEQNPDHAHVRRWFGTASRKLVRVNLMLTAAAMQPGRRPTLRCDHAANACAGALATANAYTRTINFCPGFFRRGEDGADSRFGVVVHEVSHVAAGTRDAAYRTEAAERLAKEDPIVAVTNADSYEYFVEFLPR